MTTQLDYTVRDHEESKASPFNIGESARPQGVLRSLATAMKGGNHQTHKSSWGLHGNLAMAYGNKRGKGATQPARRRGRVSISLTRLHHASLLTSGAQQRAGAVGSS